MSDLRRDLTDSAYWDDYWSNRSLPTEIRKSELLWVDGVIEIFERYLPRGPSMSALEIGGAPGGYLALLHRELGYEVSALDYSELGCRMARKNFELLGIPALIYCGDMFTDFEKLPRFDVVFSLGLIEHFSDPDHAVEAHMRYLKPGGVLLLGCPNFLGVNNRLVRRLSPSLLESFDTEVMNAERWDSFESRFGLTRLFRGYVGGFEPMMFGRLESRRRVDRALWFTLMRAGNLLNRRWFRPLRRFNSMHWSTYLLGVYRAPTPPASAQ